MLTVTEPTPEAFDLLPADSPDLDFSDEVLLHAVYDKPYPAAPYDTTSAYYVNTVSVGMPSDSGWQAELCTDDQEQAREFAITSTERSSDPGTLLSESESEKFFAFEFQFSFGRQGFFRVHKCSYFTPTLDGFAGQDPTYPVSTYVLGNLHVPIDPDSTLDFAAYRQFNGYGSGYGNYWLDTVQRQSDAELFVDFYMTTHGGGDWGICDSVGLAKVTCSFARDSGEIRRSIRVLRGIVGTCHPNPVLLTPSPS